MLSNFIYLVHLSAIYKSHIDTSDLYSRDDGAANPVAEEMQHKLNMESERLRARLRQELAELRERLSPSSSHISATLASMRERLAPITQQLQSALSSNARDLCGQLRLYLQGLEQTEAQSEAKTADNGEALHRMSQTLERGSSRLADSITDFETRATAVVENLREMSMSEEEAVEPELWQKIGSRLEREVSSLRADAQTQVASLRAEIAALLEKARPHGADFGGSLERFCQNAALQSQVFGVRMEGLIQGLKEELQVRGRSSFSSSSSSSSSQPDGSLPEDFTVQLSALIQDIMHSVS